MLTKSYGLYATLSVVAQLANAQYNINSGSTTSTYAAKSGFEAPVESTSTLQTSVISASSSGSTSHLLSYATDTTSLSSSSLVSTSENTAAATTTGYGVTGASSKTTAIESSSSTLQPASTRSFLSNISSYVVVTTNTPTSTTASQSSSLTQSASKVAGNNSQSIAATSSPYKVSITSSSSITQFTTSTIYSTNVYTVTYCAPEVKNCPARSGTPAVTTEIVSVGTTVCPVEEAASTKGLSSQSPVLSAIASSVSNNPTYYNSVASKISSLSTALESSMAAAGSRLSTAVASYNVSVASALPKLASIANTTPSTTTTGTTQTSAARTMPTTYSISSEITTSTLSTVYSTNAYTITSCAATVTDCPARKGSVTTETISLYTTICPVTHTVLDGVTYAPQVSVVNAAQELPSSAPITSSTFVTSTTKRASTSAGSYSLALSNQTVALVLGTSTVSSAAPSTPLQLTTSTVYSTNVYTVTSCAPDVTNCPAKGAVTTEIIAVYTTVCPVSDQTTAATTTLSPISAPAAAQAAPANTVDNELNSALPAAPGPSSVLTTSSLELTTSTVFTSSVYTVSTCGPDAQEECSSQLGSITTEMVALYTTICPVTATQNEAPAVPHSAVPEVASATLAATDQIAPGSASPIPTLSSSVRPEPTTTPVELPASRTSTVYSTNIYTITSCAPEVTDCPASSGAPAVTTEIVPIGTTVCPITYNTEAVTLANTMGPSPVLIATTITYEDTPAPPLDTAAATAAAPAESQDAAAALPTATNPGPTLTLGNYFTTAIDYDSLTSVTAAESAPLALTTTAAPYLVGSSSGYAYAPSGTQGIVAQNQSVSSLLGVSSSSRLTPPFPSFLTFLCRIFGA